MSKYVIWICGLLLVVLPVFSATSYWNSNNANLSVADIMYVDLTNARVGIGTSDPSTKLDITGGDLKINNSDPYIYLIEDGISNLNGMLRVKDSILRIGVANDDLSAHADILNLDLSNDYVGIGTTSPGSKLEVNGGHVEVRNSGNTHMIINPVTSGDPTLRFLIDDTEKARIYVDDDDNDKLKIGIPNDGSPRVIIDNAGNVGIGTTSPAQQLDINSTTGGKLRLSRDDTSVEAEDEWGRIEFYGNDESTNGENIHAMIKGQSLGSVTTFGAISFHTRSAADLGERMRIDNVGRVGIGTTSPQGTLDLGSGATGKSLVWGGQTGLNHYASIGTSFSSADLNILSGLKLDTASDKINYSYSSTMGVSGIRMNPASGDTYFFNAPFTNTNKGDEFNWIANTTMVIKGSGNLG